MNCRFISTIAVVATLGACSVPAFGQTINAKGRVEQMHRIKLVNGLNNHDRMFLRQSAQIHIAEIMLGELAMRQGGDWGKRYGQDMVREHKIGYEELKKIAREKRVSLPDDTDSKHKAVHDRLARLSGRSFDEAYRREMINGHNKAERLFAQAVKRGHDEKVRSYAAMYLPPINAHIDNARNWTSMIKPR